MATRPLLFEETRPNALRRRAKAHPIAENDLLPRALNTVMVERSCSLLSVRPRALAALLDAAPVLAESRGRAEPVVLDEEYEVRCAQ